MAWAFSIKPRADELLSGYLCRVATAHGATPFGFYNLHLRDPAFWARDVDRGVVQRHEVALAQLSQVPLDRIREMTLYPWLSALRPADAQRSVLPAIAPWINATGVFHRVRFLHALQFCPECLGETGTIDRHWRLSMVVACPRHGRLLSDGCPRCDAPFMPHRNRARDFRCHVCGERLGHQGKSHRPPMPADPAVLHLQAGLVSALELARERSDTEACAEMHGVRALIATLLTGRQAAVATAELDVEPIAWGDGRHQLETARRPVRGQVLQVCERLLTDWPDGFRCIARRLSLRGEHFSRHRLLPGWLRAEVERLPKGRVLLAPRRRPSLEQQLEALRTRQPDNWRALRATLMLRVAQRRS